jgi:hypothetical protein
MELSIAVALPPSPPHEAACQQTPQLPLGMARTAAQHAAALCSCPPHNIKAVINLFWIIGLRQYEPVQASCLPARWHLIDILRCAFSLPCLLRLMPWPAAPCLTQSSVEPRYQPARLVALPLLLGHTPRRGDAASSALSRPSGWLRHWPSSGCTTPLALLCCGAASSPALLTAKYATSVYATLIYATLPLHVRLWTWAQPLPFTPDTGSVGSRHVWMSLLTPHGKLQVHQQAWAGMGGKSTNSVRSLALLGTSEQPPRTPLLPLSKTRMSNKQAGQ